MKNKYENLYLFLSFLPLALIPFSQPISVLLALGLLFYGLHYLQIETFKKALNPLTVALVFATLVGITQLSINLLALFGQLITTTFVANFVFVMIFIFKIINMVFLIGLIVATIFSVFAVVSNKRMPVLHRLIDFFQYKKEQEDDEDIIIDSE